MPSQRSSNTFLLEVDGREVAEAVQLALIEAVVEDELNLPDSCEVVLRDPLRTMVAAGSFELGGRLTVKVLSEATPAGKVIFAGEITSLEAEVERDGVMTTVRAFDLLHRLQRGTHSETYLDMTYGDIAGAIARRHGLSVGDTGSNTVVHEAVVQWNQTDWEFLTQLAARIGHEVAIVDDRLSLRSPATTDDAPRGGDVDGDDGRQLVVGGNVLQLRSTISGGEQVTEVAVRGWDPVAKAAVEGVVQAAATSDSSDAGIGAAEVADHLGAGTLVVAARPVRSAETASDEAASLVQQLGSSVAELEGVVFGNPDLRAGTSVSLAGLGDPFDGKYVLTSCRHTYDPVAGYRTGIRVSGRQNRTMLGIISGSRRSSRRSGPDGVVPALVSDIDDPDQLGRVKVTYPWLGDRATSHWSRVTLPGAGPERGLMVLPEVGDEVLVAFEHGDTDHPIVLGGLWNGKDAPPVRAVADGAVVSRALVTRTGHRIELHDENDTITIATGDDRQRLVLDASGETITIETSGDVEITSQRRVAVSSSQGMELACDGPLDLKALGVTIDAGAGAFQVKGTTIDLSASAAATLDGGGTTTVRGGLVRIN